MPRAVIQARRCPSYSGPGAPRPAVTRRGPQRPLLTAPRRRSPRPAVTTTHRGSPHSPRPAITRRCPTVSESLAAARVTRLGPSHSPRPAITRWRPPEFQKPESLAAAPSESPAAARSHLPRPEFELIAAACRHSPRPAVTHRSSPHSPRPNVTRHCSGFTSSGTVTRAAWAPLTTPAVRRLGATAGQDVISLAQAAVSFATRPALIASLPTSDRSPHPLIAALHL